ncbi:GGDEF domain-containing protein [Mesorhizobium sp. CAU 1741]|uniref:GGDEF domain-containing protein n=1 Tax=Mesorhizobium sp. CAU 1741 TaxID=3140366 RepID=UPI00325AC229
MQLDFITLYVIILLNSASFAVVWATISYNYRSLTAARYWLVALVMTSISGPLLFLGSDQPVVTFAGLSIVAGSFTMMWQGLRVFFGQPFQGIVVLLMMVGTMLSLLLMGTRQEAINVIAAASQVLPVSLSIATLLRTGSRSPGAGVALAAALIVVVGQAGEATTNLLRLIGWPSEGTYFSIGAWFLVCAIIGGSVWNLGFLLMAADRFRSTLITLAKTDDLTGLANRRGLREEILRSEKLARRRGSPVVLAMIDMDKFKSINDRYGHSAGDAALAHAAGIIRSFLRDNQYAARIGGDEFCILMPDIDVAKATPIADRLARKIVRTPLFWNGHEIPISASVGLTEWRPTFDVGLVERLELADQRMFHSKRAGQAKTELALSA